MARIERPDDQDPELQAILNKARDAHGPGAQVVPVALGDKQEVAAYFDIFWGESRARDTLERDLRQGGLALAVRTAFEAGFMAGEISGVASIVQQALGGQVLNPDDYKGA